MADTTPNGVVAADHGLRRVEYDVRPVRYLEQLSMGQWRFKLYGINANYQDHENLLDSALLEAGKNTIRQELETNPVLGERVHHVGFIVLHQGRLGNWLMLDWWSHGFLWNQILFRSETISNPNFKRVTSGIVACTWEMPLQAFERDSWVREVLQADPQISSSSAILRYLQAHFNADI